MSEQEFGHYRLEGRIGSGGMGDVYRATDVKHDRQVALKLLPELFSASPEFQERFRRESRVAARLREPHIIPIHDYGEIDGRLYIDMRLVDNGTTLAGLLREEGPLPSRRAVSIIEQVAEALDAAHAEGLIHRDVKPSNVMVTVRDFVYVVDFGIAHAVGHTASGLTLSGSTVGTMDYMAPERFSNRVALDRRADIYSLACLLYQCLTAQKPFEGLDLPGLIYAHLSVSPPAPSAVAPLVPTALDEVVRVGMAKEPENRYATAGELAEAARHALGEAPTVAVRNATPNSDKTSVVPTMEPSPEVTQQVPRTEPPHGTQSREVPPDTNHSPPSSAGNVSAPATPSAPGDPHPAEGPQPPSPTPPSGRSRRSLVLGVSAVALLVVALLVMWLVGSSLPTGATSGASGARVAPAGVARSAPVPTVVATIGTLPTPGNLAIAPDGRFGLVANRDPQVLTVLDLTSNSPVATIPMPAAPPRFVAFDADGGLAYVSSYTNGDAVNVVNVVDTRARRVVATIPVDKRPYGLAVSPDQRSVWVTSHETGSIDVIDTATNTVVRRLPVARNPHWIAFAGNRAFVANHESNLASVLDVSTYAVLTTIPVGISPHSTAVSPDGDRVSVVNYDGNTVSVIDAETNQVVATVPVGIHPQYISYAPDGRHAYTANVGDGTVSVIDTATNQVTTTVPVGRSPTSVVVAPDGGSAYVTCLDDAKVTVLRVAV